MKSEKTSFDNNAQTGWVSVYRSIKDKGWYKKSEFVHLWVHILLKANHQEKEIWFNGENVLVKRGQFITGRKKLSEETGIGESKVDRILKCFKNEQQIEQQTTSRNRMITIVRYDEYQKLNSKLNNERTTTEQQVNTNNNDNNTNNVNKEIKVSVLEFINLFNTVRRENELISNIKSLSAEEASNFNKLSKLHSLEDFKRSIKNMMNNTWAKEKNILFPKHLLKVENFNRYLNEQPKQELSLGDKLMGRVS